MSRLTPTFITPLRVEFQMDGREVVVEAAPVARLGEMLAVLQPVLPELAALPDGMVERLTGGSLSGTIVPDGELAPAPTAADVLVLLELLAAHRDVPVRFVAAAMAWPQADVGKLLPDRFAYLFSVIVQVNADFFGRALPGIVGAARNFGVLLPGGEPTTSGPSSSTS